jgi:hypothetical protein
MRISIAITVAAIVALSACGSTTTTSVEPGVATHLVITRQPNGIRAEDPLAVQPILEIRDDNERVVSAGTYPVRVTATLGSVVYSTTSSQAGIVQFTDLRAAGPDNFSLTFSSTGLRSAFSAPLH